MNILHISDVHFGRDYKRYNLNEPLVDRYKILDGMIETLKSLPKELRPEHIIFTGDVAWHGLVDEFEEAAVWFKKLLDEMGMTGKDITFIVGNHDVDWNQGRKKHDMTNDSIEVIDELYRYRNVQYIDATLDNYNQFCSILGVEPFMYPVDDRMKYSYSVGYKDITSETGEVIRLLAFNTASLTGYPQIADDKCFLGIPQIRSMYKYNIIPKAKGVDYTIGMFHHAPRFLHSNETNTYSDRPATLLALQYCTNLLLYGHTESMGYPTMTKQSGGGTLMPGGALYYNDIHKHTFNLLYINAKKKSVGLMPYQYDGHWQEFDYISPKLARETVPAIVFSEEKYEDCCLVMTAGKLKKKIRLPHFHKLQDEGKINEYNNKNHIQRIFDITIKKDDTEVILDIKIASHKRNRVESMMEGKILAEFYNRIQDKEDFKFSVLDSCGNSIVEGKKFVYTTQEEYFDYEFLNRLSVFQNYFHANFYVDHYCDESEQAIMEMLDEIIRNGYSDRVEVDGKVCAKFTSAEELENAITQAKETGYVELHAKASPVIELFGARIYLGDCQILVKSVKADADNFKKKLDCYNEGDIYIHNFRIEDESEVYLVADEEKFIKKNLRYKEPQKLDVEQIPIRVE